MKAEEHTQWVGAIVTNLQALETVLRYFLAKLRNEVVEFPKVGDQTVKLSYLTRRTSLGKLIRTFNGALAEAEKKPSVPVVMATVDRVPLRGYSSQSWGYTITLADMLFAAGQLTHENRQCLTWVNSAVSSAL